jgi:O-antigen/teichoic acid export membrane protein
MRTKKAVYNTSIAIILQFVTIVTALVIPKLIIETYGSSVNGLLASITQFIGYFQLIEMGLGGALVFSLYKPITSNNISKINSILAISKNSYKEIGYYFIVLVIAMIFLYPNFIGAQGVKKSEIVLLIIAIGSTGIINYFTIAKYNVLLTAAQCNYVISFSKIIYLIISTAIMCSLITFELKIEYVYLFSLFANLIQVLIITLYTRKQFKYIDFNVKPDKDAISKRFDVLVHQLSAMAVSSSPIILITIFSTLIEVSIYSIYYLVFMGINMIMSVFNNGFTAGFGQIISEKKNKTLMKVYSEYEFLYYMILSFVYTCVIILGLSFIKIYTANITDANYVNPIIFTLFTIVGILNNLKIPQSTIIISAGHFRETRNRALIEAGITILSSLILVLFFGLKGALVASIIGLSYRSIDIKYAVKITKVPLIDTLKRILRIFLAGLIAIIPFVLKLSIHPSSLFTWLATAIFISLWVGIVVLIINLLFEKEKMKDIVNRIRSIVIKS